METALYSHGSTALASDRHSSEAGPTDWLVHWVEKHLYPEICPDDNRVAEYIPPQT